MGPRLAIGPSRQALRRRSLANRIERLLVEVDRDRAAADPMLLADCDQVRQARPELLRLVARLRGAEPAREAGIEKVKLMLTDAGSPIFSAAWRSGEAQPGELTRRAHEALVAIE